jgi:hypothetical protein
MQDGEACAEICQHCHDVCLALLGAHRLDRDGGWLEKRHTILLLDCIAICRASVDVIRRGSNMAAHICRACAVICEAFAESCQQVGNMRACIAACRRCAEACRELAHAVTSQRAPTVAASAA